MLNDSKERYGSLSKAFHSPLAWALAALTVGHIVISLLPHFMRRDDTLRRML